MQESENYDEESRGAAIIVASSQNTIHFWLIASNVNNSNRKYIDRSSLQESVSNIWMHRIPF